MSQEHDMPDLNKHYRMPVKGHSERHGMTTAADYWPPEIYLAVHTFHQTRIQLHHLHYSHHIKNGLADRHTDLRASHTTEQHGCLFSSLKFLKLWYILGNCVHLARRVILTINIFLRPPYILSIHNKLLRSSRCIQMSHQAPKHQQCSVINKYQTDAENRMT